jgi:NodT family efflux transporter outer membrane factor (OMF) lipoprotein
MPSLQDQAVNLIDGSEFPDRPLRALLIYAGNAKIIRILTLCPLHHLRTIRMYYLLVSMASLQGCAVGPDFETATPPDVSGYTAGRLRGTSSVTGAGGSAQIFLAGRDVSGDWWRLFRSKQINALVEEAVRNHPDIAAAQYALRSAREQALAETGALFPSATLNGSATREQTSQAEFGAVGPASLFTLYSPTVTVSYSPDLFGGTRRQIESLQAQADYQRFQLEATYLSLTANVVNAAINDASYKAQIDATEDIIKIESEQLDRVNHQFDAGAISRSDVLSQQSTLATTQATLPPLRKSRAQQRNQLMAYLGRFPSEDHGEAVDLATLHLPRDLPVSLPSFLVRQRPDIRSAEATVHQASATIGVAISNMLPDVTLTASAGSSALSLNTLFSGQTTTYSLAGSVAQKIFDGGQLYHTKEADVATYQQDVAKYQSTVLSAFQNVADSLRAIQADADTLKAQVAAEKVSLESLDLSRNQYKVGAVTYPTVLNAEQTYQNARISRVKAQAARFSDTTALYQSLGGGWWQRTDQTAQSEPRVDPGYFAGP